MAIPRHELVDETVSGLYHCVSRCVRQAYLIGPDPLMRRPADNHRRDWMIERLVQLTDAFAIDVAGLAIMSNHFHLILRTLPEVVATWSDAEVAYRWLLLHPLKRFRRRLGIKDSAAPTEVEVHRLLMNPGEMRTRRNRLASLSWFMKELKEWLAKRANREDERTGAFWEERFKSYRILDDYGLMLCASYVDLNPVRAGLATDPLGARYTSVEMHARRLTSRSTDPLDPASGYAFWKRVAEAPDSTGRIDRGDELNAFIAQFESAAFSPAMPCRREPLGIADRWSMTHAGGETSDPVKASATGAAVPAGAPATLPGPTRGMPGAGRARTVDAEGQRHRRRRPPQHRREAPLARAGSIPPPLALASFSLADHFRRLRTMAEVIRSSAFAEELPRRPADDGASQGPGTPAASAVRTTDAPPDPTSVGDAVVRLAVGLTGRMPVRSMKALRAMLIAARMWGAAIGTHASMLLERKRRRRDFIVMALRPR